jgi:nicotinamide mononucleotide transporter
MMSILERAGYAVGCLISLVLLVGSLRNWVSLDTTEVLGFITGAWGVWLTVKRNIWNWPIGLLNNLFFLVLFVQARLFADSGLQVIYLVLGFLGWYWWIHGGPNKSVLPISHVTPRTVLTLLAILVAATAVLTFGLARINDAAPFWDALTTVLSLIAQYMLTRKFFENWAVWLSVDVIYVGLYAAKGLPLTAVLYALFFTMCIAGLLQWRTAMRAQRPTETVDLSTWTPRADYLPSVVGVEATHG